MHQYYLRDHTESVQHIQPHGVVLFVDRAARIVGVSANTGVHLRIPAQALLGTYIKDSIPVLARELQNCPDSVVLDETAWAISLRTGPNLTAIELVPMSMLSTTNVLKEKLRLFAATNYDQLVSVAVDIVREILGWDHVLFHRIRPAFGHVVAEDAEAEPRFNGSYLPFQSSLAEVRSTRLLRHIPNVRYGEVEILTLPEVEIDIPQFGLDMQGVPLVFREMTTRLNGSAAMQLDIIVDDALWGILEARHRSPSIISEDTKSRLYILSYLIAQKVHDLGRDLDVDKKLRLSEMFHGTMTIMELLEKHHTALMEILDYNGIVYRHSGFFINGWGDTPRANFVTEIVDKILLQNNDAVICRDVEDQTRQSDNQAWFSSVAIIRYSSADGYIAFTRRYRADHSYEALSARRNPLGSVLADFVDRARFAEQFHKTDLLEFVHQRIESRLAVQARRLAEEQLRRTEERYKHIVDNQSDLVCRYRPDTVITFVNDPWQKFFGLPGVRVFGTKFTEYLPAPSAEIVQRNIQTMLNTAREVKYVLDIGNDTTHWLQWICRPLLDEHGHIYEIQGVGRDISDVVAVQLDLRERERQLKEAQRIGRIGDWQLEVATGEVKWSETVYEMFGYPVGMPMRLEMVYARIEPNDLLGVQAALEEAHRDRRELFSAAAFGVVRPDHSVIYCDVEGRIEYNENDQAMRMFGVIQDVTDDTLAMWQIEESKKHIEAIYNAAQVGIVLVDRAGQYIEVNQQCLDMYGFTYEEMIGKDCAMTIPPGDQDDYRAAHRSFIEHGTEFPPHWTETDRAGRMMYTSSTAARWFDKDGHPFRVSTVLDVTEQKKNEERISYMAHYDSLTGLPNRELLKDRLQQAITFAGRRTYRVALLYIDLDHFKNVNDTLGHDVGDQLLIDVSQRLKSAVRDSDTVARLSGDEFAVITYIEDGNREQAGPLAERIIARISEPFHFNDTSMHSGCSIGIAVFPDDAEDRDQLLKFADMAMYRAKKGGRKRYQFYNQDINVETQRRRRLEEDLRDAIEIASLEVYYQPKICLEDGRIVGVEALMRWPSKGWTSEAFIQVAEESGLIREIGQYVLRRACKDILPLLADYPHLNLSVNVSPVQFRLESDIVGTFEGIIRETGYPAERLILEITEHDVMHTSGQIVGQMVQLNKLGIRFSIDDFGTGFSSLRYLRDFPFHELKIDQSFIGGLPSENNAAIVRATVSLGRTLGLSVVAEGVEQPEQADFIRALGCDQAQGYNYSPAVPAPKLITLLATRAFEYGPN